ncbi:MAG: lysozyme inhibitor LprI family protein [Brevundimonas sp.]|uniref:lysozyme inhibitor LprI family protein n=1 Tax=Brevundimonas sp. TaxID=1871086 RepID=UPI00391D060C
MILMFGLLVGALSQPSFNCDRAETGAERAICADADLSRQDRELATLYRDVRARLSPEARAALRQDQRWFLGARDQWFENRDRWDGFPTLAERMEQRSDFLASIDAGARGWTGRWRNAAGALTVTEEGGRLTLAFNTAHPANARWLCDVSLTGDPVNGVIEGPADMDGNYRLSARLLGDVIRVDETLVEGRSGPPGYCGANGFVSGSFFRVRD